MSEDQIQATLERAIGEGGLGAARAEYENNMVADASTTIFTVNAGGLKKTVSVYALGMDDPTSADVLARAAFQKLAASLGDFDHGGTIREPSSSCRPDTEASCSTADRGAERPQVAVARAQAVRLRGSGRPEQLPAAGPRPDRRGGRGARGRAAEGGLQGATLIGPDGKFYAFSLRPLLPGESS